MSNVRSFQTSRSAVASRLLNAALRGQPSGAAPAVTVTDGLINTSVLTGLGYASGYQFNNSFYFQNVGAPYNVVNNGCIYNNGGVVFVTDAPSFEFWMRAGKWELWVDGVQAAGSPFTSAGDGYKLVDFGTAVPQGRRLELRFTKATHNITGVAMRKPYSVWPAPLQTPKVHVIGDSLTEAVGYGGVTAPNEMLAAKVGRILNWDTWADGQGGTGYTQATTFISRVSSIPTDVDAVILAGGINDYATATGTITAAVMATLQAVRIQVPNALNIVLGPWRSPGRNPSQAISDAIKDGYQAVADGRMTFVDTYAENWQNGVDNGLPTYKQSGVVTFTGALVAATSATLNAVWPGATGSYTVVFDTGATKTATITNGSAAVSWSGAITAGTGAYVYTAASGNSGIYMLQDTIHFDVPGHAYIGRRIADAAVKWLRTLV